VKQEQQRNLIGIKVLGEGVFRVNGECPNPLQPWDNAPASVVSITPKGVSTYIIERSDGSQVVFSQCPVIALYEADRTELALNGDELARAKQLKTILEGRGLNPPEQQQLDGLLARAEKHGQTAILEAKPPVVEKALEGEPKYRDENDNPLDDEDIEGPPGMGSGTPTGNAALIAARMASVGKK
jgi:hypothetical protein